MRKRSLSSNYSTLWRICQGLLVFLVVLGLNFGGLGPNLGALGLNLGVFSASSTAFATDGGSALSPENQAILKDNCTKIKDTLNDLQHQDSRARVYLGRQYETILSKFITPLNLRLVENNISSPRLLENQSSFAAKRTNFVSDYIKYQQSLEELVALDCKAEPDKFYEKLVSVREKRAKVASDVASLKALAEKQKLLASDLRANLETTK